ncbi:hypothetical protein C8Q78DRAFT_460460 [Trametes maxima]|nr:hypothetical protein C8Q78DRAFT_460460 [Trametes maxima]
MSLWREPARGSIIPDRGVVSLLLRRLGNAPAAVGSPSPGRAGKRTEMNPRGSQQIVRTLAGCRYGSGGEAPRLAPEGERAPSTCVGRAGAWPGGDTQVTRRSMQLPRTRLNPYPPCPSQCRHVAYGGNWPLWPVARTLTMARSLCIWAGRLCAHEDRRLASRDGLGGAKQYACIIYCARARRAPWGRAGAIAGRSGILHPQGARRPHDDG